MSTRPLSLDELDRLIDSVGLPVREATLEQAWTEATTPDRISEPGGRLLLLVSMHARPETAAQFEEELLEFVAVTNQLLGSEGSTAHRSSNDPLAWFLLERFRDGETLARHMGSDYFGRFRVVQQTLLSAPVEVHFLAGTRP